MPAPNYQYNMICTILANLCNTIFNWCPFIEAYQKLFF
jgi:hypothetical protein